MEKRYIAIHNSHHYASLIECMSKALGDNADECLQDMTHAVMSCICNQLYDELDMTLQDFARNFDLDAMTGYCYTSIIKLISTHDKDEIYKICISILGHVWSTLAAQGILHSRPVYQSHDFNGITYEVTHG